MEHLSFQILLDFCDDKLSKYDQQVVTTHLSTCTICQRELAIARLTLSAMRAPQTVEPPLSLHERLTLAYRRKLQRSKQALSLKAALQFDSRSQTNMTGMRGSLTGQQVLYSTDSLKLDFQVGSSEENGMVLRGQLLPNRPLEGGMQGYEIQLLPEDGEKRYSLTDEIGQFRFSSVAPGTYAIHVLMQDAELIIESLEISG